MSQINKEKENVLRFEKIKKILFIVFLLVFLFHTYLLIFNSYDLSSYPQKAVIFLNKQDIKGNVLSTYNVGGYLIWKMPSHKVFIDGRMPAWRRTGFYPNESNNAFEDYLQMLSDDKIFAKAIKKYNITYVLFPYPGNKNNSSILQKAENLLQKTFFKNMDLHVLSEDLTKFKMHKVYDDGSYVIYKK